VDGESTTSSTPDPDRFIQAAFRRSYACQISHEPLARAVKGKDGEVPRDYLGHEVGGVRTYPSLIGHVVKMDEPRSSRRWRR